ncbi:hypothetical protein LG314_07920 [Agrococcus terreus]|uniref:hypothetical protein n=1 Tax=Agrococcus terreus TaxID=574649 RepID=UPI00384AD3A5
MEVDLALNARKFQAGVQDAERELKDFSDVLDDLVDSSEDVERKSTDAFEGMADGAKDAERAIEDAQREVKDLTDEFKDAAREADDLGRDADDAGDKTRRSFDRASDGMGEFKDEAKQSARETAASFREVEDGLDLVQEVAANAFAGFGPAGVGAGIAAAAGIGLAVTAIEAVNEAEAESRERAAEWAQVWIDNGSRVLSSTMMAERMNEIVGDQERWAEVVRISNVAGVEQSTVLRALAGDQSAYAEVQGALSVAERDNADAIAGTTDELTAQALGYNDQRAAIGEAQRTLDQNIESQQQGAVIADAYTQALLDQALQAGETSEQIDEVGNSVYELPDGSTITVNAETGVATRRLEGVEEQARTMPDANVGVNVTTSVADAALRRWQQRRRGINVTVNTIARNGLPLSV